LWSVMGMSLLLISIILRACLLPQANWPGTAIIMIVQLLLADVP
jgi:hypothetical protein